MTCLSAAVKALKDEGVLDCITYLAGLSGSSWWVPQRLQPLRLHFLSCVTDDSLNNKNRSSLSHTSYAGTHDLMLTEL